MTPKYCESTQKEEDEEEYNGSRNEVQDGGLVFLFCFVEVLLIHRISYFRIFMC